MSKKSWEQENAEKAKKEIARVKEEIHEATQEFAFRDEELAEALADTTGYYDLDAAYEEYDRAENVLAELHDELDRWEENYDFWTRVQNY